jgi:hypothetical protein
VRKPKTGSIRGAWVAGLLALSLLLPACASAPSKPGNNIDSGRSYFAFRGPDVIQKAIPARISFVASITGPPLPYCLTEIVWDFGPLARPARESHSVECQDRNFESYADFPMGYHFVTATLKSNGQVLGTVTKWVKIGAVQSEN